MIDVIPRFKKISNHIKDFTYFASNYEVSTQYPGLTLEPSWKSGEIILSVQKDYESPGLLTVAVISYGDIERDLEVCLGIERTNRDLNCRVILLKATASSENEHRYTFSLGDQSNIIAIGPELDDRDSASTIAMLAGKPSFEQKQLEIVVAEKLGYYGMTSRSLKGFFEGTSVGSYNLVERISAMNGWKCFSSRSIPGYVSKLSEEDLFVIDPLGKDIWITPIRRGDVTREMMRIEYLIKALGLKWASIFT